VAQDGVGFGVTVAPGLGVALGSGVDVGLAVSLAGGVVALEDSPSDTSSVLVQANASSIRAVIVAERMSAVLMVPFMPDRIWLVSLHATG
jgi:hypothetical protein